jgi:hypothetical protein
MIYLQFLVCLRRLICQRTALDLATSVLCKAKFDDHVGAGGGVHSPPNPGTTTLSGGSLTVLPEGQIPRRR